MDYCGFVIRRERMARGWSQQGLCKGVCAVSYLSKIEQGQAAPSREVLDALYARLNLPVLREPQRRDAEQCIRRGMEALLDGRMDAVREAVDALPELRGDALEPWALLLRATVTPPYTPLDKALEPCLDHIQLAIQRQLQGRSEEACRLYPCALLHRSRGIDAYEKGDYTAAMEALQTAYRLAAEEGRPALMLDCRMFMGNCCSNRLDVAGMRAHYAVAERLARALNAGQELYTLRYNTGATLLEAGRTQEAYDLLSALPDPNPFTLHKLAICLEKLHRPAEALRTLDEMERQLDATAPDDTLTRLMARVVRLRLQSPDPLHDPAYGDALMNCFHRCRAERPAGYAGFHLPWVLEWLETNRQYKQACELLKDFPVYIK
ncbi:MAG: helix-turn-helix domain-containing protein [Candidatus Spyradocola sp.]